MELNKRIVIIGGGLSGLTLAYLLLQHNIKATVLEGANRLGGRIHTLKGKLEAPMELGATWVSDMHPNLISLIDELGLKKYPQFSKGKSFFQTKSFEPPQEFFVPEAEQPSYRIAGGTSMVIKALRQKITQENIQLNSKVISIREDENELVVETNNGTKHYADIVILCLPPQLAASAIQFSPGLPEPFFNILPSVQTWMAGAIKFVLEYAEPFWRNAGYSGMLYSHSGIVAEMYDHTNFEENRFGLTGFLNSGAASYSKEVRKNYVLRQLQEMFGEKVWEPTTYSDKVWTDEFVSGGNQIIQQPHQNQGHPLLQQRYMNEKLFFSGTETATGFPGYMEGAVISAHQVTDKIINNPKTV